MTAWMQTYDAVFFVSVGTLVIGFLGLVIKYCLKSKCENVKLCFGFIEIHRRVDLETQYEIHEIDASATDPQPHQDLEMAVAEAKLPRQTRRPKLPLTDLKTVGGSNPQALTLKAPHPKEENPAFQGDPAAHSE
jgi:hypothetical protein